MLAKKSVDTHIHMLNIPYIHIYILYTHMVTYMYTYIVAFEKPKHRLYLVTNIIICNYATILEQ